MISPELITAVRQQFAIDWYGLHGIRHWARVYENGLRLAATTGANLRVVALFALFHDSCRYNEGSDPGHGLRGAVLAAQLNGRLFTLDKDEFRLLDRACRQHTAALTDLDITVQTCFDSDRLDLGRVGSIPDPKYLCTEAAKSPAMIKWALEQGEVNSIPDNVLGKLALGKAQAGLW